MNGWANTKALAALRPVPPPVLSDAEHLWLEQQADTAARACIARADTYLATRRTPDMERLIDQALAITQPQTMDQAA